MTDNSSYTGAYTYAADGTRIRAQESNAANTDKWFQCDGVRPVLEGTLSNDTFTTLNRYTWEGDSYYSPLAWASIGGSNRYYMYDGLGSTRQLLNADQTTTDTYSYEAFGNSMGSTGSTTNPYRYVGSLGYYQIYPPEGGPALMHLGARYYMPEIGRFVQQDPLGRGTPGVALAAASPLGSSYLYAEGNPCSAVDATGQMPLWGGPGSGLPNPITCCVQNAWDKANRIAGEEGLDLLAHCFFVCKASRCTGVVTAGFAHHAANWISGEARKDHKEANKTGAKCGAKLWWFSCEKCCRARLPRLGWR